MSRVLHIITSVVLAGVALTSVAACAPTPGTEMQSGDELSSRCSVGFVYEWDDIPGSPTRGEELDALLEGLRAHAAALPPVSEVAADDPHTDFAENDPIRMQTAIRGVEALVEALPAAEIGAQPEDTLEVEAFTAAGASLASATIVPFPAGGYRLDRFSAAGWASDHPSCPRDADEDG